MTGARSTMWKFGAFAVVMLVLTACLFAIFGQYRAGSTNSYSAVFTDVSGLEDRRLGPGRRDAGRDRQ